MERETIGAAVSRLHGSRTQCMMMNSVCFCQALQREASWRRRGGLCLFVTAVMQTGVFADAVAAVHVMIDATAGAA